MHIPITAALVAAALAAQQPPPPPHDAQDTAKHNDGNALHHPDPDVDALLDELEAADHGLADATASITYIRHDIALESVVTRMGRLVFVATAQSPPRPTTQTQNSQDLTNARTGVFGVTFHTLIDDLNRKSDTQKRWVFDGRWLVEQDFATKTYTRREIARPGEGIDPMRLGEGPLPIPIGQHKRDILQRYRVTMPAVTAGLEKPANDWQRDLGSGFVSAVEGRAVQLRLVPRVEDPEGFDEIRLWYRRDGAGGDGDGGRLLPILAKAVKQDRRGNAADVAWVFMSGVETNTGVDRGSIVAPPPEGEGWSVEVRRLPRTGGDADTLEGGAQ